MTTTTTTTLGVNDPEQQQLTNLAKVSHGSNKEMSQQQQQEPEEATWGNNSNEDRKKPATSNCANHQKQMQLAIQMSQVPLVQAASHWDLAPFLIQNLQRDQYTSFFPIQSLVIPHILASERHEHIRYRDICVSSPTGSGKTLAFVLPILHSIYTKCSIRRRLRALCVLPSRDLAVQVHQVFQRYSQGSDIQIGLAIGQSDFYAEQQELLLGRQISRGDSYMERNKTPSTRHDDDDDDEEEGDEIPSDKANNTSIPILPSTTTTTAAATSTQKKTFPFLDPEACMIQYHLNPRDSYNAILAFHANHFLSTTSSFTLQRSRNNNTLISSSKPLSSLTTTTTTDYSFISKGGRSAVDILVCTPGRLMDHLNKTPGFTLQHVRFLVMDEADRLLNQSYQNWLQRVLEACTTSPLTSSHHSSMEKNDFTKVDPVSWRQDIILQQESNVAMIGTPLSTIANICHPIQLRKLLFSATMTQDPQKLSSLGLIHPQFFNFHGVENNNNKNMNSSTSHGTISSHRQIKIGIENQDRFSLPMGLSEYTLECTAQQKPLVLLALLLEEIFPIQLQTTAAAVDNICVLFTSSVESTHRLTRLLQLVWSTAEYGSCDSIAELSSALSQTERSNILQRCSTLLPTDNHTNTTTTTTTNRTRVKILVCSDGMSRGMDISHVSTVINYDIPTFAKTYIHRCGRTARGGQQGKVINIMKQGQVSSFHKMRGCIDDKDRVISLDVKKYLRKNLVSLYKDCVKRLGSLIASEKRGEISPTDTKILSTI